jgi:hypothetical protein
MSAEHAAHAQQDVITFRKALGGSMELAAAVGTPLEMLVTGLIFWPLAIGGALYLIGRGIRKSGQKEQTAHN